MSSHPIQLRWKLLEILILLVIISLGALFVYQVGRNIDRRMEELKVEVLRVLEQKIGRRISYESISPSVFGYLGIRGLTIYSYESEEQALLAVSQVKVYYNIFRFLTTKKPVLALAGIQIANSVFDINYERDKELLELLDTLRTGGATAGLSPPALQPEQIPRMDISGTNITIRYTSGDWGLQVANLFFTVSNEGGLYALAVRGSLAARRNGTDWMSTRLRVNGRVDRSLTWSDLAIRVYSLSTGSLDVRRQTLQVTYDRNSLRVRKIQDRSPLDIQFLYDSGSRDLSFQFNAENLRPSSLFQLVGPLERFDPYLDSLITSAGTLNVSLEQPRLSYSADLLIELPENVVPFEASIHGKITGNQDILYLSPLALDTSRGKVEFLGNLLLANLFPAGLIHIEEFQPLKGHNINATLDVLRGAQTFSIQGPSFSLGATSFDDFTLSLTPQEKGISFLLGASLPGPHAEESGLVSALNSRKAVLEASGRLSWASKLQLQVESRSTNIPLYTVYRLLVSERELLSPVARRLRPYTVSAAVEAFTDFSRFRLSADSVEVRESGLPENSIRFSIEADNSAVEITGLRAYWNETKVTGDVRVQRGDRETALTTLFWIEDIPYQIELKLLPGKEVRLSGSYGLQGTYLLTAVTPFFFADQILQVRGNPFQLRSDDLPVPLQEGTLYVSVDVDGLVDSRGAVYARSRRTELRNIPFYPLRKNSLELSFLLIRQQLSLDRIVYQDAVSTLVGNGAIELEKLVPLQAGAELLLEAEQGPEMYRVKGSIDGRAVRGELAFDQAPLQRFGTFAVTGSVSGTADIGGALPRPDLRVALSLNEGRLNLDPLGLNLELAHTANRVELSSFNLSFLTHKLENGSGSLDLADGRFSFTSRYRANYFERPVNLRIDVQGSSSGLDQILPFNLESLLKADLEGTLRLAEISVNKKASPDWLVTLAAEDGVLAFAGGPQQSIRGTISRSGEFTLNLLEPLPVQGQARGTVIKDQLESTFAVSAVDMKIINTLTPGTDIFTFTRGTAFGSLRITGPINDPDWYGYLDVVNAELVFLPSPDRVGPLNARLVFEEKSFTLPRTTSFSGKTRITGEGVFLLDRWIPEALELTFQAEQYPGVHIRYTFSPIFVDGYATGTVRVRADRSTTILDGAIQANSCRIALQRQEEEQVSSRPVVIPLAADLKVSTGRSVEFYWPAMNFPVVRTYARQGEKVRIYLNEDTGEFFVKGEVEIRGGEVFYFDRSFTLKQGRIAFEETPAEFDPWIYALAEIRERDLNNEEIKIFLEANNKLSLFSPRFYSEPSRPDVEILNLIGGTILNRFEETDFGTAAVMLTSDIVGQFGILTPFERAVRDILNLDLFSVRTQFLQNVLIGKIRGENLTGYTLNPLDNTTLTLGKYLGTDLFLEALVRFQSIDDFTSPSNIRTEGELNLEWVTPFFLLEWTFTPMHPENLFLSDNSIGLSWKFSY